ncbi:MAG: LiaF transmembrane domain-containing protein, partial [Acetivibrio ethanolgignens]
MRSRLSNILWGLFFILIGIGFAGNAFNLWDFNLFFPGWWTFFIIIPCGISIIQNGFQTGTSIGLVIGVMLLLSRQGFFNMRLVGQLIIPVILVIVGLGIMFANTFQKTPR